MSRPAQPQPSFWLILLVVLSGLLLYGACYQYGQSQHWLLAQLSDGRMALFIAPLLYFVAHVGRSIRLALISVSALGLSFRSALLIHFLAAPWSFILPYKLDEICRWSLLAKAGASPIRAAITLLIDRSFDGLVLVSIFGFLGQSAVASFMMVPAFLSIVVVVTAFLVAPPILMNIQRYLFLNHQGPRGLSALKVTDRLRHDLYIGRLVLEQTFPFVLISTLIIWSLELCAIWVVLTSLASASMPTLSQCVDALFSSLSNLRCYFFSCAAEVRASVAFDFFFVPLLLAWPVVAFKLIKRLPLEPKRLGLRVNDIKGGLGS